MAIKLLKKNSRNDLLPLRVSGNKSVKNSRIVQRSSYEKISDVLDSARNVTHQQVSNNSQSVTSLANATT